MTRILLADNSPHAQRMGERILREEGFEVVTVTDGQTALVRLADVDPDVVLADVSLPGRSGYDICREVKTAPRLRHIRVVLTAGLLDHFDDGLAVSVRCDGVLKKPFEASATMDAIRPLIAAAQADRAERMAQPEAQDVPVLPVRVVSDSVPATARTDPDAERIRAAVTLALDAALPEMINQITQKVLIALRS